MKYLSDHSLTHEVLIEWVAETPLVTARYYFWSTGSEIQVTRGTSSIFIVRNLDQVPGLDLGNLLSMEWFRSWRF